MPVCQQNQHSAVTYDLQQIECIDLTSGRLIGLKKEIMSRHRSLTPKLFAKFCFDYDDEERFSFVNDVRKVKDKLKSLLYFEAQWR